MNTDTTQQQFEQLIQKMSSNENQIRDSAEKIFHQIPLEKKAMFLFQVYLNEAADEQSRSLSLILLRQIFSLNYNNFWISFGPEVREKFHEQILKCVKDETKPNLVKRLTEIIAIIAQKNLNNETKKQEWTGVLQFLNMCILSEKPKYREIAMSLIEKLPSIFGSDQSHYINEIKQSFHSSLLYATDISVRVSAVRAFVSFMCINGENEIIRSFSDLIPAVIEICKHVVANEDNDDIPLQCLNDLAFSQPKTLFPYLNKIFDFCIETVNNRENDHCYRSSALEVMVTLCEKLPNIIYKKGNNFIKSLILKCLQLMTELDDNIEEWLMLDNVEDENEEQNSSIGESSLDRLAYAFRGRIFSLDILKLIEELLQNDDWKCRHAAIMALSSIGEGCKIQMEPIIQNIISNLVLPSINDPHPRVRYACCNAIGQMCSDFEPTVQEKCHKEIVSALLDALVNSSLPRVAAHAGAAIVNFCEGCPKNIISIYLPLFMEKMEIVLDQAFNQLLKNDKKIVLEQVITSIASLADAAGDNFIQFYSRIMPPLKFIFTNVNVDKLKLLRGKTIECISLIGLAVGYETFQADANEIMRLFLSSGINFESSGDPQISYIITAWTRICKIMGQDFAQYLDAVMPAVMQTAEYKSKSDIDDVDTDNDDEDFYKTNTAELEDKLTACEMLVCYARELQGAFAPYVEQVLKLMLEHLKFQDYDEIRLAASECIPCLLECAKGRGNEYLKQIWNLILEKYKDAIKDESNLEVLCQFLNGIGQCVEELGIEIVSKTDIETIFTIINEQLDIYEKECQQLDNSNDYDDDIDEEDQDQLSDLDELGSVLAGISDVIHYLFITFEDKLTRFFVDFIPRFSALLGSNRSYQDRQWGFCIFDDFIEFGGETTINYQQFFFEPMLKALSDSHSEVRQAAAYGCGIMGLKGGPAYALHCARALEPLAALVSKPNARDTKENMAATENAISAVSKILKYNCSALDPNNVIPTFISWLPVWYDVDEVPYVYDYFCDLVESNHTLVLGDNNSNLPRIFEIILCTFSHGVFDEDKTDKKDAVPEELKNVKERLIRIIHMIKTNDQVFQAIINNLRFNSQQQIVLQKIFA